MKYQLKKLFIVGLCVSAALSGNASAYDGRGAHNCNYLANQVSIHKQALDEWNRKARQSQGTWQMFKLMNRPYQTSQTLAMNRMGESLMSSMRDDTAIQKESSYNNAVHAYNMNGCTSGGQTVYNR